MPAISPGSDARHTGEQIDSHSADPGKGRSEHGVVALAFHSLVAAIPLGSHIKYAQSPVVSLQLSTCTGYRL